jgi:hypothetical protein
MRAAKMKRQNISMFGAFVILPIAFGTAIYVGWRTTSLLVFDWMAICGIPVDVFRPHTNIPQVLLYSLPDGCWVFAGTSWMLIIWRRLHAWVFIFAGLAIGGEFGQAFQIVPGTFEWNDITFYTGGFILALIGHEYAQTLFVYHRLASHGRTRCG